MKFGRLDIHHNIFIAFIICFFMFLAIDKLFDCVKATLGG